MYLCIVCENMNVFVCGHMDTIFVKKKISFFLSIRILSIYIFKVNYYSRVSNLGEGKLRFWDFSVSIFNFCMQTTEK